MELLSERLRVIADMIDHCGVMADIGCDHGYLSIAMAGEKKVTKAIAMDLRSGPLEHARKNIRKYGLEDIIDVRLSDGMQMLSPGEADVIVIAGMGGPLMTRILDRSPGIVGTASELILEPQSEPETLREYLSGRCFPDSKGREKIFFSIKDERFVKEEGKYYPVIKYLPSSKRQILSEEEKLFGPVLIREKPPLFREYLENCRKKYRSLAEKLEKTVSSGSRNAEKRLAQIRDMEEMISAIIHLNKYEEG